MFTIVDFLYVSVAIVSPSPAITVPLAVVPRATKWLLLRMPAIHVAIKLLLRPESVLALGAFEGLLMPLCVAPVKLLSS